VRRYVVLGNWIRNYVARQVVAGFRDGLPRRCGPVSVETADGDGFLSEMDRADNLALPAPAGVEAATRRGRRAG
jgi:hypothetical protein